MTTEVTTTDNPTLLHMRKARNQGMYRGQQNWAEEDDTNINPEGGPEGTPNPDTEGHVDANLTPEERTYAKRYADLRRQEAKNAQEYKRKMEEMEAKIADLAQGGNKLPVSEADIQEWMGKYPDLANAILHVADSRTKENVKHLKKQLEKLEEDSLEVKRERAFLELKRIHPDVDAIRESDEFHAWVDKQPGDIQGWFYENETDHFLAARGIQLFKLETGWKPGKKKGNQDENRANSRTVVTPKAPELNPEGGNKKQWRESDIKKLKGREYEALEEELDLAAREGRIIYDLKNSRL